jgi:DNA repair exonuclease SbcCD ATPase subunit
MGDPVERNDRDRLEAERRRLERRVRELTEENERLRRELEKARIDRDDYIAALRRIAPDLLITEEDIRTAAPPGPWFHELIERLERGG